jgi:hypothetical protein
MENLNLFNQYDYLMEVYIDTIIKLIDESYSMKILPLKVMFGLEYAKKYIQSNRFEVLQNGLDYLLTNKMTILNFDIANLDELDEDFDDNVSIKSCINNIKKSNLNSTNKNNFVSDSDDMLNLMIEIKNNAKKLHPDDIDIIKKYFELLVIILENISKLFK